MVNPGSSLDKWRGQRGSAGLEFAFLFTIFFAVFYAALCYAFVTLVSQGLIQAAAEGARAAVKLDPTAFASSAAYEAAGQALAKDAALNALGWLPQSLRNKISTGNGITSTWSTSTITINTGAGNLPVTAKTITVQISLDYASSPLIPAISLPGIDATIPTLPALLVGKSTLRVTS